MNIIALLPQNQPKNHVWKNDPDFPPLLNKIRKPPEKLFFAGQKLKPIDKFFAIVGTRRPTQYGKQIAREFSTAISQAGFVVVSGLAYGIDAIAHQAALDAGGKTIAVLGAGLNNITPTCNIPLAEEIKKTGAIITEYEQNIKPNKGTFPQRNRIIAGMSVATLIVEAPEKSGALITARLALEYNRDVFAVPGNITQESSRGVNKLIQNCCAYPVSCPKDIFDALGSFQNENDLLPTQNAALQTSLKPDEEKIYNLLKQSSMSIDEICIETKIQPPQTAQILSMLEIKSLITVIGSHAFITR